MKNNTNQEEPFFFHKDIIFTKKPFEIYTQLQLKGKSYYAHTCGYVTPKGVVFDCEPYSHINLLERLIRNSDYYTKKYNEWRRLLFKNNWWGTNKSCYDDFFMIELEWAKIAAYGNSSPKNKGSSKNEWEYDWWLERAHPLTKEQTEIIFPR